MKNKLLAGIFAILVHAALAGCDSDSGSTTPTLDWGKAADYVSTEGDRVLGTASAALDGTNGRYKETVLGNFAMDGIAEYARHISGEKIDFAMHNGQDLRISSLPAGDLVNSVILTLHRTDTLVVTTFTGRQVKDVIEGFVKSETPSSWSANCAVMVSKEVKYTIDNSTNPPEAKNIRVNNAAIDDAKEYRIVVGSFIGNTTEEQAETRFIPYVLEDKKTDYMTPLREAVAMYILAKGTVNPSDYPLGRYTGEVPAIQP